MRVIDAFIVNDELDLLELRLRELSPVVDHFYAVEAPVSLRGRVKPTHVTDNIGRFAKWADKLTVHVPDSCIIGPHPIVEMWQRRKLGGAWSLAETGDIVLMGDVDEIPNREAIAQLKAIPEMPGAVVMKMNLLYGGPRFLSPQKWYGTVASRVNGVIPDCQNMRNDRGMFPALEDSGWHLSWWGGEHAVSGKLKTLDVESDIRLTGMEGRMTAPDAEDWEKIQGFVRRGEDLFGRPKSTTEIPLAPGFTHPHEIREWLAEHPEMNT